MARRALAVVVFLAGMLAPALNVHGFSSYETFGPDEDEHGRPVVLLSRRLDNDQDVLIALGELAFKSHEVLGIGFSCDSCHPDGGASRSFFFAGLSDKPGNIDVTNRALTLVEDGLFNPVNIPSIRGSRHTAPFRRDGLIESTRDFAQFAIVNEFHGPEPSELMLDAFAAFQAHIPFPDNPWLDDHGQLTAESPAAARRGAAVFQIPISAGLPNGCASCHKPTNWFVDRLQHDVGTGRVLDTPTLRDLAHTAPYFHDGRHDTLAPAVTYFVELFNLDLTADQTTDLISYVELIGAGPVALPAAEAEFRLQNVERLIGTAVEGTDYFLVDLATEQIVWELGQWQADQDPPPDITPWTRVLRQIEVQSAAGDFDRARSLLSDLPRAATVRRE